MLSSHEKYNDFINTTADNISNYLGPFIDDLDTLYTWNRGNPLNDKFIKENIDFDFDDLPTIYEKTIHLKKLLKEMLHQTSSFEERFPIGDFFVRVWGGVKGNKNLKQTLADYDSLITTETIDTLEKVSSWSKYLSLINDEAHIYDSRVAYAINVINYVSDNKSYYFKSPSSQSRKLNIIDIETLFVLDRLKDSKTFLSKELLKHSQTASKTEDEFHLPEELTYKLYLELLNLTGIKMQLPKQDVFKLEMLLFALASENILESLVEHIRNQG